MWLSGKGSNPSPEITIRPSNTELTLIQQAPELGGFGLSTRGMHSSVSQSLPLPLSLTTSLPNPHRQRHYGPPCTPFSPLPTIKYNTCRLSSDLDVFSVFFPLPNLYPFTTKSQTLKTRAHGVNPNPPERHLQKALTSKP